jgi:hypothetical protein
VPVAGDVDDHVGELAWRLLRHIVPDAVRDEDGRPHDTAPPQEAPKDFTNAIVDVDAF